MPTALIVNGTERRFDGDTEMPLLWYLRDELGLTGTKFGCGIAQCGACTVHIDGTPALACQTPVTLAESREVPRSRASRPAATTRCRWPGAS